MEKAGQNIEDTKADNDRCVRRTAVYLFEPFALVVRKSNRASLGVGKKSTGAELTEKKPTALHYTPPSLGYRTPDWPPENVTVIIALIYNAPEIPPLFSLVKY